MFACCVLVFHLVPFPLFFPVLVLVLLGVVVVVVVRTFYKGPVELL